MSEVVYAAELEELGVSREAAHAVAGEYAALREEFAAGGGRDPEVSLWLAVRDRLAGLPFDVHHRLYQAVYRHRDGARGPGPAWVPDDPTLGRANLTAILRERRTDLRTFAAWSSRDPRAFWRLLAERLRIVWKEVPRDALPEPYDVREPDWFPGGRLNIADSCFQAPGDRTAILHGREGTDAVERWTYAELESAADRVTAGLEGHDFGPRVALYMPMTPESVAAYLGIVRSGRAVVGIADASAAPELRKRVEISGATEVVTSDAYARAGKRLDVYGKARDADAPRCVVVPSAPGEPPDLREGDLSWDDFLGRATARDSAARDPSDVTNILFSSGTTKDPKAIPWTHVTPIKCIADAYLHHDVHEDDVLAWPTSFGWMMGPWLTYASLANGAAMALYSGAPTGRDFGSFVASAGVTMLGVVPKLVRIWREGRTMEGLDWSRVRRFSSTGETSDPEDMLYLMWLAGYAPVIEYCGGTEVGGGYVTGTMVQPAAPGCFTGPALGLDFHLLDDEGRPSERGEVALRPPSVGLSNSLLNYDHRREYFDGMPAGPEGEVLRRHGDQMERAGPFLRHLGRMDDMINVNGVKTSSEEIRHVLLDERVRDVKPVGVDVDGSGQQKLVVYALPRDPEIIGTAGGAELSGALREVFSRQIRKGLNPLLANVEEVVLVAELPQAGPGKTATAKAFVRAYLDRRR